MDKSGDEEAEGFKKQDLARGRGEQIGSAHDLVDAHETVIDDNGELIGEDAVGTAQDKVANCLLDMLAEGAGQEVDESDDTVVGDAQAQRRTPALGFVLAALVRAEMTAGAWIGRPLCASPRACAARNFGTTAIAGIDQSGCVQPL